MGMGTCKVWIPPTYCVQDRHVPHVWLPTTSFLKILLVNWDGRFVDKFGRVQSLISQVAQDNEQM